MFEAQEKEADKSMLSPEMQWDDFKNSFAHVGTITLENYSKSIFSVTPEPLLFLYRAYQIHRIVIINGNAEITVREFNEKKESFLKVTFSLSYDVTQLNLPHLATGLIGHNFRIELTEEEHDPSLVLDKKYCIQLGKEDRKSVV